MGTGGVFLRRLRAKVSDRPTGFVWVEDSKLAGSGYPSSRGQVEWLAAQGINSILTLTPNPLPIDWTKGLSLDLGHVPMQDHGLPDMHSLDEAAAFVRGRLREEKVVVVHCLAGEGRTGCVLASYLISQKRMKAEEALATLRKIKPQFVETAQEESIYDYAKALKL